MEDNINLLGPASPELGTAQPQLVLPICYYCVSPLCRCISHSDTAGDTSDTKGDNKFLQQSIETKASLLTIFKHVTIYCSFEKNAQGSMTVPYFYSTPHINGKFSEFLNVLPQHRST
jgi:hypothetical protein